MSFSRKYLGIPYGLFLILFVAYKLLKSGKIKAMRIGRVWKIPKRAVQEYIVQEAHMKATGW